MNLYHMTHSANKNHSIITRSSSHVLEASIKYKKKFCVLYIAYEVGISCKGPFSAVLYGFFNLENQLYVHVFQTAPVVVYILRSVG